ncbi:MAG: radical SAM protein [Chloroflexi bacterium]|nr:radical SAM protein [Chloroflexota bacterium]
MKTENWQLTTNLSPNLGAHRLPPLPAARFPDAGAAVQAITHTTRPAGAVDILLVNPPAPDGGIWIRSQHRVGRRSRENMIWPQVDLAQMAALLAPDYTVEIVDCIATRMGWPAFERLLEAKRPKYYLTQVTAPTLRNDMRGVFLAKALGAKTIAFGTHVTPWTRETMRSFPALDFILRGEPEMTLRELLVVSGQFSVISSQSSVISSQSSVISSQSSVISSQSSADSVLITDNCKLKTITGLAWRRGDEIVINPDRPFIASLDDLPMPLHHLLPLDKQRMPMIRGPFTFIVTSRGCPAGCKFCIKHVSYQTGVRLRSPQLILEELKLLVGLGVHHVHMYADLFTVKRDQVVELCRLIIESGLRVRWTCNSRVDYVDEEMLRLMGRAGCWYISWGIESANEEILKRARKGYRKEQAARALGWAKAAGIHNWGYFIIGLPGETEATIQQTIAYAKSLPLDICLFHIAAPYPGTPFFYEVVQNGWFRPGTAWEEVDMDQSTVLDYPGLPAERLEYWQRRATREWSLRPGPMLTFLKGMNSWEGFKSALSVAWQTARFVR